MILKIFNTEVVDCSSSWNEVVPNPQSRKLLLDIFLKICESEAVVAISGISMTLDFRGARDKFSPHRDITFRSSSCYHPQDRGSSIHQRDNYVFQTGIEAENDKLAGLFIERKEFTIEQMEREQLYWDKGLYLLPSGLRGIRKAISIIKSFFSRNYNSLPEAYRGRDLKNFSLDAYVVWKEWAIYKDDPADGRIINGEFDVISAQTEEMQLLLGGICEGGQQGRENGSKHFPSIQQVLNENWPDMFEVKELNGG